MKKPGKLVSALIGVALTVPGCTQNPKPKYFFGKQGITQKNVGVIPFSWPILILHGGQYKCNQISENGQLGVEITKYHWTNITGLNPFKPNYQKILLPKEAKNIGVANDPILQDRIYLSYDLGRQRYIDEYHVGLAGDKCKHEARFLFENNKKIKIN